jgi:RNA polymerase sigma-70 factor, Bacteroides expansion family 1
MRETIDEKAIMEQIRAGDQTAFDNLFRQYYRYLVVVAFRYLKDDHRAKDMVQEVFLDFWKRRDTIRIEQSIKAFLRRAVVNNCLSTLRKNQRIDLKDSPDTNISRLQDKVDQIYEYKELEEVVEAAVRSLPERCQLIFRMSRQENLSHKEIAEKLDISTKTIENQMTKALKIIREALKKYGLLLFLLLFTLFK